jgi:hypothetical protein
MFYLIFVLVPAVFGLMLLLTVLAAVQSLIEKD